MAACSSPTCPVSEDLEKILRISGELAAGVRDLRQHLKQCEACPNWKECRRRRGVHQAIANAIDDVTHEWEQSYG